MGAREPDHIDVGTVDDSHRSGEYGPWVAGYHSPRAVRRLPPQPGQALLLEVVALTGRGYTFNSIRERDRMLVLPISGETVLADVLEEVAQRFGLDDLDHPAELRLPSDRGRLPGDDDTSWPGSRTDDVWSLYDSADQDGGTPGRSVQAASILGQGDVAYLRYDFDDEWWWRVRVVAAGAAAERATGCLPAVVFNQRAVDPVDVTVETIARYR